MPTTYRNGSDVIRLADSQVANLYRLLRMERRNPHDPESVLLTRSEFSSLKRKGLAVCYRVGAYKGKTPAYLSELGRRVILKIEEAEQLAAQTAICRAHFISRE